ncbi:heterokaryon incompatibility protein-domain-containing protein [Apiospora arundinis]
MEFTTHASHSHQQPDADADDDCSFCVSIKNAVGERGSDFYSRSIVLDTIMDQPCHQHLLCYMRGVFPADEKLTLFGGHDHGAMLYREDPSHKKTIRLLKSVSTARASGLVPDKDWVDMNLLRGWKTECLTTHGQHCCSTLNRARISPAWLIDTWNDCLVPGDRIEHFVALSYVWGARPCLRNERAILQLLEQPGALSQEPFCLTVSPMIRHSMDLIRALGERYLWADALCIVQDDAEQTAHQLRLMGDLYASATFTIVATDEDASGGIPGIKGVSRPRNLYYAVLPFGSEEKLMVQDETFNVARNDDADYGYFTRGWTYQEYALSQRLLVVGKKQFHWVCSSAAFREDVASSCPGLRRELYRHEIPRILSGHPDLEELIRATRDYNGRHHSFPEDALAGFTGILEIFKPAFEGGFLYGLPLMYFPAALMWRKTPPLGETTFYPARALIAILVMAGLERPLFELNENSGSLESTHDATFGISQWYSHETPTSTDRHAIGTYLPGEVFEVEDGTLDCPLARGWTADTYDAERDGFQALVSRDTVYRHTSMPNSKFWRWFPIRDPLEGHSPTTTSPQHAFISCKTKRAWVRVRNNLSSKTVGWLHAHILDIAGNNWGWLQASSDEQKAVLPFVNSDNCGLVEVVAICFRRGSSVKNPYHPRFVAEETFGILWVEWVDGVAYRKGVGEINKDSWESHVLEDVDLILG